MSFKFADEVMNFGLIKAVPFDGSVQAIDRIFHLPLMKK
jgi:hypothetical protein